MSIKNNQLDCRGLACPQPLIQTKKRLEEMTEGVLSVWVDNLAAKENVIKFAVSQGCQIALEEKDQVYMIHLTKGTGLVAAPASSSAAAEGGSEGIVYLLTQDVLGHGSSELGAVLMKGFLTTLAEKECTPKTILLMNSGVKLAVEGSPVIGLLERLTEMGVELLSCGTCLDYYQVKEKLCVGGVTNMYTIVEKMSQGKTITL